MGHVELVNDIVLANTLVVLEFKFNLLSVSKLTRDNNCVAVFYAELCLIHDCATKTLKGIGKERGGLYHYLKEPVAELDNKVLQLSHKLLDNALSGSNNAPKSVVKASASHQKTDFHVWHQRLGHVPMSKLRHINCIPKSIENANPCLVCPMAKFTKLPYPLSPKCSS